MRLTNDPRRSRHLARSRYLHRRPRLRRVVVFLQGCGGVEMSEKWWVSSQKPYTPETLKWYCGYCKKITNVERNPLWNGNYSGERPAPDWFVRCIICKNKHWQRDKDSCPNCGCMVGYEQKPLSTTKSHAVQHYEYISYEWDETHRCRKCKTVFAFTNSTD